MRRRWSRETNLILGQFEQRAEKAKIRPIRFEKRDGPANDRRDRN